MNAQLRGFYFERKLDRRTFCYIFTSIARRNKEFAICINRYDNFVQINFVTAFSYIYIEKKNIKIYFMFQCGIIYYLYHLIFIYIVISIIIMNSQFSK